MGDFFSVKGSINPPGVGPSVYQFVNNPVGMLGQGTEGYGLDRSFSLPASPVYGPGQGTNARKSSQPGLPYAGVNRRDLSTQSGPVSPVSHDTKINSLLGNGAYLHGVITLQDLINVQQATGTPHNG